MSERKEIDKEIDEEGVDRFAVAMKEKLAKKRAQGYGGWSDDCTVEHLADLLIDHVPKGDPVDIANFCMMVWNRTRAGACPKNIIRDTLKNKLGL